MAKRKSALNGAKGCRIRSRRGYLSLSLHYLGRRWSETPIPHFNDTTGNRERLEREYCAQIYGLMRARAFDGEAYLRFFPEGTWAREFRSQPVPVREAVPTLRDYAVNVWLPRQQPPDVRPAQVRDYRQHLNTYVLNAPVGEQACSLGNLPLDSIRRRHVQALRDRLRDLGLKPKTARNIIGGTLAAVMRDARELDDHDVQEGVCKLRWPRLDPPLPDPFTVNERATVVEYFRTRLSFWAAFAETLFFTGMRPSEATGLQWQDFDSQNSTLNIVRSYYMGSYGLTKTRNSRRTILLLPNVAGLLRARMPLHVRPDQPIFADQQGRPINQGEWARAYWARALRATGLRLRKFYTTRHTFISIGLGIGVNLTYLAKYCGTSVAMIEKHYGRFMPENERAQLALLFGKPPAAQLFSSRAKPRPRTTQVAVSGEKPLQEKVVPTGIEPVLPT